jgi:oxygen-dependent protoporphyrinogen oxidase
MDRLQVVVVGGGLAGLFTASELLASGVEDVVVVEAEAHPGGVARTIRSQGFAVEPAAGTLLLPHPHLSPVLERVGAQVTEAGAAASTRYVYTGDRLVTLEPSPKALLAPVVPWSAKLRAFAEPLVRSSANSADETLDEFCRRRFGAQAGGMLAWLAASGVFAGDPAELSAEACFPVLVALESEAGSVVKGALRRRKQRPPGTPRPKPHLPVGGTEAIARAAAARLDHRFRGGFEVGSVARDGSEWVVEGPETLRARAVVMAAAPWSAAGLLNEDVGTVLEKATAAPVAVVALGGQADPSPIPPGFGALVGPGTSMVSRGILFESSYAPDRAPEGSWLVKVIAGGAVRPEVAQWSTGQLIDRIAGEVAQVVGAELEPSFVEVVRHLPGIPQYPVGHREWLRSLDHALDGTPGLHLTGWGYRGVGLAQLAADATRVARRVAETVVD